MQYLTLFILLLWGCSQTQDLKYKYNYSKKYLSSMTSEDTVVQKITVQLKDEKIFSSGMDSTYLLVKLYDEAGDLLTSVDPNDLTLSTSVDIEAKPFTLKQGVYKAEILPRVKSSKISMRVDWLERVASPVIVLHATVKPLKESLIPVHHDYWETKTLGEINISRGSRSSSNHTEGFSFDNMGPNKILKKGQRTYLFHYLEHAEQNVSLMVDDAPNNTISQTMHSLFMFFPRKQLPTVEQNASTLDVTLPTGEKVSFKKDSKEIVSGVFSEGAQDKNHFVDLKYSGKGIVLRVNGRGQSPEIGQFGKERIDEQFGIHGTKEVLILNGSTGQRCVRPKTDFWEPMDVSPIVFKFSNDSAFEAYLLGHCGFGIPKL